MNAIVPIPRIPITIRPATIDDLPFIDALQKKNTKSVGFMQTKALEGKIRAGNILVAWASRPCAGGLSRECMGETPMAREDEDRVGYLIGHDQYFKRDDVGIIYQINVAPGRQRGFVGAALLKAQFERSAYGCKLYCCWCAQDIEANRFWEAMGFVPLAFRAGSEKKQRVHIFWSKRIREGDTTTPWWFPAETKGGSMMEDRLVFPIPPGTHWSDAKPIVLPRHTLNRHTVAKPKELEDGRKKTRSPVANAKIRRPLSGGLTFGVPVVEKPKRAKREKIKNDPKFVAAARELRDRWMEKVNEDPSMLESNGKYNVARGELASVDRKSLPHSLAA